MWSIDTLLDVVLDKIVHLLHHSNLMLINFQNGVPFFIFCMYASQFIKYFDTWLCHKRSRAKKKTCSKAVSPMATVEKKSSINHIIFCALWADMKQYLLCAITAKMVAALVLKDKLQKSIISK